MRQGYRALAIAGYIISVVSLASIASAQDKNEQIATPDSNARVTTQNRNIVVIQSAYCSLPSTPANAPCNPPCPPRGCPGICISGQCIKEILK
jgi:hypothetical protein